MATASPKQLRSYHPASPSDRAYQSPDIACSCSSFWWSICLWLLHADESWTTLSTLLSSLDSIQRVGISHFPCLGKVSIHLASTVVCSCRHLVDDVKTLTWMLVMFLQRYTTTQAPASKPHQPEIQLKHCQSSFATLLNQSPFIPPLHLLHRLLVLMPFIKKPQLHCAPCSIMLEPKKN